MQEVVGRVSEELVVGPVLVVDGSDLSLGELRVEVLDELGLAGHAGELDGGPLLAVLRVVHHLDQNLKEKVPS